jgi:predicted DNA-binding protein (UPF0251 family)
MPGYGRRHRYRGGGRGRPRGYWREPPEPVEPPPPAERRTVFLTFDEVEALRLVDLEGLTQEEAAKRIGISRRTLWQDLKNARAKVAHALVNGLPIRVVGGSYIHRDGAGEDRNYDEE